MVRFFRSVIACCFSAMNQDQEVPAAAFSEFGRLGCLFGTPFSSPCYQQHQDHYKATTPIGGIVPTDWKEPWHQEGNSCETDDSEHYLPESECYHHSSPSGLKSESGMPDLFHNFGKTSTAAAIYPASYPPNANFDGIYTAAYQHAGCFYSNALYGKMHHARAAEAPPPLPVAAGASRAAAHRDAGERPAAVVKQEPEHGNDLSEKTEERVKQSPDHRISSSLQNSNGRRGSLQLWQFLVALLDAPDASAGCIAWTGRGMEFKLIEPEEVARRWGAQKNRPAMNYDKLSRSLRYYYEKGIMQKVAGERYVYKFVCDPEALFNMAYGGGHHMESSTTPKEQTCESRPENLSTKPEPHHLAYSDMLNFYNCGIAHSYQHLHPYLQEGKHTRFA